MNNLNEWEIELLMSLLEKEIDYTQENLDFSNTIYLEQDKKFLNKMEKLHEKLRNQL